MMKLNHYHTIVINLLSHAPMPLADLQAASQISLPTLRRTVQDLVDDNWVRSVGQSRTTGGRPATLYGLDDTCYFVIGVHLQLPGMQFVATNLSGDVIHEARVIEHNGLSPDDAVREIAGYVEQARELFPERQLLGIGVATPGYVDPASGEILSIGRVPAWQNFPIKARLEADLELPVTVDNDVDCMAIAELHNGGNSTGENIIYLGFHEGVKVSLFLGGTLYKGPFGNAGLIGHNIVVPDGPCCSCGKRGCLEAVASIYAVCQAFDREFARVKAPTLDQQRIGALTGNREKFHAILEAADGGDAACKLVVEDMFEVLSRALAAVLNLIQPDVLIVGGALSSTPVDLRPRFENRVRGYLSPLLSNYLVIQYARFKASNIAAIGVTHQFLKHYVLSVEPNHAYRGIAK